MRLLNDLLNMHDGFDDEGWLKECKKYMNKTFPQEDPFSIIVPAGFELDKVQNTNSFFSKVMLNKVQIYECVECLVYHVYRKRRKEVLNFMILEIVGKMLE